MTALSRREESLAICAELLADRAQKNVPIGSRTTYRVGGNAALLCEVQSADELDVVAEAVHQSGVEVLVLGAGSNLLISDQGFFGLCIVLGASFTAIEIDREEHVVRAGSALAYPVLARRLAAVGLSGMEWAVGIPGSVGGAVAMNTGGHGAETADRLIDARLLHLGTGERRSADVRDLELSYRHSNVAHAEVVLDASFSLDETDPEVSEPRVREIVAWRREHQPGGRNAGSVFANPAGDAAGRLIDAAGLKGHRVGSAVVSDKHANFFLIDRDGSADDLYQLIFEVRRLVAERTSIELSTEVRFVGFGPDAEAVR